MSRQDVNLLIIVNVMIDLKAIVIKHSKARMIKDHLIHGLLQYDITNLVDDFTKSFLAEARQDSDMQEELSL